MYDAAADPYCYPGTAVLRNRAGLTSQTALDRFEAVATGRRFLEPMPAGRWGVRHYRAIHRHIFQDVFDWAGRIRTIRIAKDGSMFCYPENIDAEMRKLFAELAAEDLLRGLRPDDFARRAAHLVAELNAIHPFREGNGRTQLTYLTLLAARAGHPLALDRMQPAAMLAAMVANFKGDEAPLAALIEELAKAF